ncbi:MAG: hypothetical protein RL588_1294 [Pseudomonadota bacterium]
MTQPRNSSSNGGRSPRRQPAAPGADETAAPPTRRPSRLEDSLREELMGMGMTAEMAEAWIRRI